METVQEKMDKHVEYVLSNEWLMTDDIKYILIVITEDNRILHNLGTNLCYLLEFLPDEYDEESFTVGEVLTIEMNRENATIGAIYEKKGNHFKQIVRKGF